MMFKPKSIALLFGLEVLALASYLWHQTVSTFIGWERNWLYLQIILLVAFLALFALGLYRIVRSQSQILSKRTDQEPSGIFKAIVLALSPLIILCLIFLQHFVFLKDIRPYLLLVSLAGCAYLVLVLLSRLKAAYPQAITLPKVIRRINPDQFSKKRLAWFVFLISLVVYIAYTTGLIVPAHPFTGDEPHYLLNTQSIIKDGDINVYNNYRDMDYSEYYPGDLANHAYPGKKGTEYLYSKHFIALSALMLPTYAIGNKIIQLNAKWSNNPETKRRIIVFFARLPLCLITALFSLVFFLLVLDMTQRKDVSFLAWALFSFTSPILFFSHLLYPAVSVALLTIFVFKYLILNKKTSSLHIFASGTAIGLMPWFGVKFLVLAAILFGISAFCLLSDKNRGNVRKRAFFFLLPIVLSAAFYIFFFWTIYGNLSPTSAYTGVAEGIKLSEYSSRFFRFPLAKIISRCLGFFIDQKYGIFVYTPLYILGCAGLYLFLKNRRRETALLLTAMTGYWIFTAKYYWGGYCPPGRPIIPVFWIWGLFLATAFAEKQSPFRKTVIYAGVAVSVGIVWAALRDPWILYHGKYGSELGGEFLYSKLARALSNSFVNFYNSMPSLRELEALNWLTLIIWIFVICIVVILFIRKKETEAKPKIFLKITGHLCFVILASLILLTYIFFDIHLEKKAAFPDQGYELYFQDDNHFDKEVGGFWTKGKRTACVILKSPQPLSSIEVILSSSVGGNTSVQVGSVETKIKRTKSTGYGEKVTFSSIKGFPMKQGYLYTITIANSSGFVPYQLERKVKDNRHLGVFVQIKTSP